MRPGLQVRVLSLAGAALLGLGACSTATLIDLSNLGSSVAGERCQLDDDCTTNLCLQADPDGGRRTCQCSGTGGACAQDSDCCIAGSSCCTGACEPGACLPSAP